MKENRTKIRPEKAKSTTHRTYSHLNLAAKWTWDQQLVSWTIDYRFTIMSPDEYGADN